MAGHVLIVGAGQGGFQFATSMRQSGYTGAVTLVGDEPDLPYQRPPLSKAYLKEGREDRLHLRKANFYECNRITLRLGRRVRKIDRSAAQALLDDGTRLDWDRLVLATGTRVARPPIKDLDMPGVYALRSLADARRLRADMLEMRQIVVIGGGFIGLEFAAVARAAGRDVCLVEGSDRLMARAVSPDMSTLFQSAHAAAGVRFEMATFVASIEGGPGGRACGVRLSDGRHLSADAVILAAGVVPNSDLAQDMGLEVCNGIVVDAHLTTADPRIHALGDCAAFPDPVTGAIIRLESVQAATDHARCLAAAFMGARAPYAALPWFWSDQGPLKLQIAGLAGPNDTALARTTARGGHVVIRSRDGQVSGVETLNAPSEHMAARKLLSARRLMMAELERHGCDLNACVAADGQGRNAAVTLSRDAYEVPH